MKLSLSFFLASVAAVASASLRGNLDGPDTARIVADRRNLQADSNMVENEDGSMTMTDESGSLTFGEDGIVMTDTESGITITISDEGVFMTDAEGTKTDISSAVDYDEATGTYTLDDGEGNSISFNEDGFMITGEDGSFVGADGDGIIMGDGEDGIMMGNEEGMIAADGDGMIISDEAGNTITATEDGITVTTATGEVITIDEDGVNLVMDDGTVVDISPFVGYDEATGTYTLADEEGNSISFNEEGFMVVGEDGSFIGADDTGIIAGNEDGEVIAVGEDGIATGSMEDFMDIKDTATDENGDCLNIPDIVCGNSNYSILCSLLEANTGLFSILSEEYTLFAPTDAAFAAVAGPLETLDEETVQDILLFHLVDGAVRSTDMECGGLVTMVSGYPSRHACKKDADRNPFVVQKGGGNRKNNLLPKIISADVPACDGIIHAVDNVLLPNYIGVF